MNTPCRLTASLLALSGCLAISPVFAQRVSDLGSPMSPVAGAVDEKSGARVESVEQMENNTYKVTVTLPEGDDNVEEVIVIGDKEEVDIFKDTAPEKEFEIVNDPDTGRRGLVFYVGEKKDFVLRFNYHEDDGMPPPPRKGPVP